MSLPYGKKIKKTSGRRVGLMSDILNVFQSFKSLGFKLGRELSIEILNHPVLLSENGSLILRGKPNSMAHRMAPSGK